MKLVVLSYCNPLSRFVIDAVHRHHPIEAILRVSWQPSAKTTSRWQRLFTSPVANLQHALRRRVEFWQQSRIIAKGAALLSPQPVPLPNVPCFDVASNQVNSKATAALLRSLKPDLLLVSHAPILKPSIFEIARVATLNIHWGIAPQYCGEHTLFWPLYFGDDANIGATIHRIDRGIDTGPILAQVFPALRPSDNEATIIVKCTQLVAETLPEILDGSRDGDPLLGWKSPAAVRLFLRNDRRLRHSLTYWLKRQLFGYRPRLLPVRRELFLARKALLV